MARLMQRWSAGVIGTLLLSVGVYCENLSTGATILASERILAKTNSIADLRLPYDAAHPTGATILASERILAKTNSIADLRLPYNAVDPESQLRAEGYPISVDGVQRALLSSNWGTQFAALKVVRTKLWTNLVEEVKQYLVSSQVFVRAEAGFTLVELDEKEGLKTLQLEAKRGIDMLLNTNVEEAVMQDSGMQDMGTTFLEAPGIKRFIQISSALRAARIMADRGNPGGFQLAALAVTTNPTNTYACQGVQILATYGKSPTLRGESWRLILTGLDQQLKQFTSETPQMSKLLKQVASHRLRCYVGALIAMGGEESAKEIAKLAQHPNPEVRKMAESAKFAPKLAKPPSAARNKEQ